MRQVYQNDFSPAKGNALQAAVASIFDLSLDEVPNFIQSPDGYESAIKTFYKQREPDGQCIKIVFTKDIIQNVYLDRICILRGKSPRGDFGHVVVARYTKGSFEMIHDPHPDGTFLDKSESFGWCLFFL